MKRFSTLHVIATPVLLAISAPVPTAEAGAPPIDRVLWTFQMPSNFPGKFLAVGGDGTIYATDLFRMYALAPDGALLWTNPIAGGRRPIVIDDNGVIYSGSSSVVAVNPDGSTRWQFLTGGFQELVAGPGVGPDGNIYAAEKTLTNPPTGIGYYALDPDGQLLWSNGSAFSLPGDNSKIVFGVDRLFAGITSVAASPPITKAVRLDNGDVLWSSQNIANNIRLYPQGLLDGRIVLGWGQVGLTAVTPGGAIDWTSVHPGSTSVLLTPTVGPDGVIYTGDFFGVELWALDPDGTTRWVGPNGGMLKGGLGVAPDNSVLVAATAVTFGQPDSLRGYDPANGDLLWQVDFGTVQGFNEFVTSFEPAFSDNSDTAYITTGFPGNGVGHSFIYAIDVTPNGQPSADLNSDGVVNGADLAALLTQWGTNGSADLNGDGVVNGADLATLLTNWG